MTSTRPIPEIVKRLFAAAILFFVPHVAATNMAMAQLPPAIGYMFPPGGQAGQTIEVLLGGYDWTPDMQVFVHHPHVTLELLGPPGPILVPKPPYWFGKKARRGPFLLPRETRARLKIPADTLPGVVQWQAANANGATARRSFLVVGAGEHSAHVSVEKNDGGEAKSLPKLPATVFGQVRKIEQVDRYRFTMPDAGLVTCSTLSRTLGAPLNSLLKVVDESGEVVAEAADTAGTDTATTFLARAGHTYTVSVCDVDFRGNRTFVYALSVVPGPRVLAAIPAAGRRGDTRSVKFVGYGLATGALKIESVSREIAFPVDKDAKALSHRLITPHGVAAATSLLLSDLEETVEPASDARKMTLPLAVTGVLAERFGEDRYQIAAKKGDFLRISLAATAIGSPLDVAVSVLDAEGKELSRNDDLPGTTDAGLAFRSPSDGEYSVSVTDTSGHSGSPSSLYRLVVRKDEPDFKLYAPQLLNAALGGPAKVTLNIDRRGGFTDPISLSFSQLPAGVAAPTELSVPAKKNALSFQLAVAGDAIAAASLIVVHGEAEIVGRKVRHDSESILFATTIKPPFAIDAEGKDDVTKWPRGTTFPAPVLIERAENFKNPIVLEMSSRQGRHRQGIRGPELTVPPNVSRILYPVFLPEWLETTRTSRMVVNGVAKVKDPQGSVRYSVSKQKTRMGFLPVGALLKLSTDQREIRASAGGSFSVLLKVGRATQLTQSVRLELVPAETEGEHPSFTAEPRQVALGRSEVDLEIKVDPTLTAEREHELTIRATALRHGTLPVVSETKLIVLLQAAKPAPSR